MDQDFPVVLKKLGSMVAGIKNYFLEIQKNIDEVTNLESEDQDKNKKMNEKNTNPSTSFISHSELRSRLLRSSAFFYSICHQLYIC